MQESCKKNCKKAWINHINNNIQKWTEHQTLLALCQVKMPRLHWCGPSQENGTVDRKEQARILVEQFKSTITIESGDSPSQTQRREPKGQLRPLS